MTVMVESALVFFFGEGYPVLVKVVENSFLDLLVFDDDKIKDRKGVAHFLRESFLLG